MFIRPRRIYESSYWVYEMGIVYTLVHLVFIQGSETKIPKLLFSKLRNRKKEIMFLPRNSMKNLWRSEQKTMNVKRKRTEYVIKHVVLRDWALGDCWLVVFAIGWRPSCSDVKLSVIVSCWRNGPSNALGCYEDMSQMREYEVPEVLFQVQCGRWT